MEPNDIPFWSLLDLMIGSVRNAESRERLKRIRSNMKKPGGGVSSAEREWVLATFRSNKSRIEEAYRAMERAKVSMATGKTQEQAQREVREVKSEEDRKRRFEQHLKDREAEFKPGKFGF